MHFFGVLSMVFAAAAMAVPASLDVRNDEGCVPVSYTISDYKLVTSAIFGSVDFKLKAFFSTSGNINDPVQDGAHCSGSGVSVPNNNECQVADRRLLFDLRGPQDQAYYQISHTWSCSG
jgi:hypothetical protein